MDYLDDLFVRLENENLRPGLELPAGVTYKSDLTVAWEALQEAKRLNDPKLIEPLKKRLEGEKITKERINIINVIVFLANNIGENYIADYIISIIRKEKVRWIRSVALTALCDSKIEITSEKEYLFNLIEDKDWQIKLDALELLKRLDYSFSNRIEDCCIKLIEKNKTKPYVLSSICSVLAKHGSFKSINLIKEIAKNDSKAFAVNSALEAISKINGTNELDFFIEIFKNNRNNDVKSVTTRTLCEFGDKSIIELLVNRAKNILANKRKTNIIYVGGSKPELVYILEFLIKFEDMKIAKFIEFVASEKIDFMDETELLWFNSNIVMNRKN